MSSSVQNDSVQHLIENNDEYRDLSQQHSDHSRRLDELGARRFPTAEEQLEELQLKKDKLRLKDRMYELLRDYEKQAS
jgi:hypothetical protein